MVDGCGDGYLGDDLGLFAQRLDLDLEPRVRRRDDLMSLRPVVLHPAVPTPGGHPKPVDQHDRQGIGRLLSHGAPPRWRLTPSWHSGNRSPTPQGEIGGLGPHSKAMSAEVQACWVTLITAPFGSRTKNRLRPQSSSVSG